MSQKLICRIPHLTADYAIEIGSGLLQDKHKLLRHLEHLGSSLPSFQTIKWVLFMAFPL